ncbi:MAG: tartrate dehydrogenase [Bryobacteraceae bacterium]|nr:tartrate dehydrogenase [Bryobacteraceae bacterium]
MKRFSIALLPGDGIGMEVVPAARQVLESACGARRVGLEFTSYDWGSEYYFRHGVMMPVDALERLRQHDAILMGAVGHPDIPDHITLNGLLLPIRRGFDLYANVRPAYLYAGVKCPLVGYGPGSIDMVVVRENTEGEYAQAGGFLYHHMPGEVAVQTSIFTRAGVERIIRYGFELARRRRGHVTSITKSNAQGFGLVLWDRVFREVAGEYPDVGTASLLVDAAAMDFVRRPGAFDVVVASNLFGDILSDLSAMVTGSIGLAPSANLDPGRKAPSLFEPVHGSAPDIAGKGVANPMGTVLAAAMMMEHLGEAEIAAAMEAAVRNVLASGEGLTRDLGGEATTAEVAGELARRAK